MALTQVNQGLLGEYAQYTGFKNRIINGAMMIDQRNAGASVTASVANNETFTLDRWSYYASQASKFTVQQNAGSVTIPSGFTNYLGITSSSAYSITSSDWFTIRQAIEGFNFADLGWGTANAAAVTLSFWVRSSLTGTFGGSLRNSAANRSYPFSYTISSANTWEQKIITIAGDTSGTWVGATNGIGVGLFFGLGVGSSNSGTAGSWASASYGSATGATSVVGTNGATFYITGVQLEKGSTATSFDYRPYGTELALCQRYYYKHAQGDGANDIIIFNGFGFGSTQVEGVVKFPTAMRTGPSLSVSNIASTFRANNSGTSIDFATWTIYASQPNAAMLYVTGLSGTTNGAGYRVSLPSPSNVSAFIAFTAEL